MAMLYILLENPQIYTILCTCTRHFFICVYIPVLINIYLFELKIETNEGLDVSQWLVRLYLQ